MDASLHDLTDDERLAVFEGLGLAAHTAEQWAADHEHTNEVAMRWRTLALKIAGSLILERT